MFELFLGVLVKWVGVKEETIFLNSKMVAFSVLAALPIIFILNIFTNFLFSAAFHGGADEILVGQTKEDDSEMQCAVCLCEVTKGEKYKVLPKCKHGYHASCIDSWLVTNLSCPMCRSEVKVKCISKNCRFEVVASFSRSFFEGFCKSFLGLSTDSIGDDHYFY